MQQETTDLRGGAALVTGAGHRIGAAIARTLHDAGMTIALHYRSARADAQSLTDELNARRPGSVVPLQADLLAPGAAAALVARAVDACGGLRLLVNNASSFYATPVGTISETQWDDLLGTNLRAPLFLCQAAAPHLRESGGAIVNIADIHAGKPLPEYAVYCAAKAGLVSLTRSLARELAPRIRVNAIAPGVILWPAADPPDAAEQREIVAATPLQRAGTPGDIARTVLFLAGDSPYVTGQVISVDGGRSLL